MPADIFSLLRKPKARDYGNLRRESRYNNKRVKLNELSRKSPFYYIQYNYGNLIERERQAQAP